MPRDDAPRAETRSARMLARMRGLPWFALASIALVVLSAAWAIDPIREATTGGAVAEATLERPAGYVLIAPVSAILDTITLLTVRQHVALLVTLVLGWAAWWWWSRRERDLALPSNRRAVRIGARIGIALVMLLGLYAVALMVPRPMAALRKDELAIVSVDFHAHTKYSHDGRWNWEAEDVRRWHRKAGFDVAYVSDTERSTARARAGPTTRRSRAPRRCCSLRSRPSGRASTSTSSTPTACTRASSTRRCATSTPRRSSSRAWCRETSRS